MSSNTNSREKVVLYVAKDLRSVSIPDYGPKYRSAYPPCIWARFDGDRDSIPAWKLTAALLAHIWRQIPAIEAKLADEFTRPAKREEVYKRLMRIMESAEGMFAEGDVTRAKKAQEAGRSPYVAAPPPAWTHSPQIAWFEKDKASLATAVKDEALAVIERALGLRRRENEGLCGEGD